MADTANAENAAARASDTSSAAPITGRLLTYAARLAAIAIAGYYTVGLFLLTR